MMKEFFGVDLDDALQCATKRLGIPVDELVYRHLEQTFARPLKPRKVGIVVEYEPERTQSSPRAPDWIARVEALRQRPNECAILVLETILLQLGLKPEVTSSEKGEHILLTVRFRGEAPDTRRGDMRELRSALQHLINRALNGGKEGERRFIVDFGGDLEDRAKLMAELAKVLAAKVHRLGQTISVQLMDAQDRRLLHLALIDDPTVTTFSQGDGRFRILCIQAQGER